MSWVDEALDSHLEMQYEDLNGDAEEFVDDDYYPEDEED